MAGYALSIIPGKVGELIKSQILKTKFNVPRTKTASIIVIEQIYNLIGLVTVSCIGLGLIMIFQINQGVFLYLKQLYFQNFSMLKMEDHRNDLLDQHS